MRLGLESMAGACKARAATHALATGLLIVCAACEAAVAQDAPESQDNRLGPSPAPAFTSSGYDDYLVGNAEDASPTAPPTNPTAVLMGGGADVGRAFRWMVEKAGGGDFVVLRTSGDGAYGPFIYKMGGVDSVETLVIKSREGAADPFVVERLAKAEAVFITGGDQSTYVKLWKNTPIERTLRELIRRNVPVGGTSAGMAVLGEFDFTALHGGIESPGVLANPYARRVTLGRGFVLAPAFRNTLTDDHFVTRDRMGRLLGFVGRLVQDGWVSVDAVRAIAVDEHAALLVEHGMASRVGTGAAYFVRPTVSPAVCAPGEPLSFRNVAVQKMAGEGLFDLNLWSSPDNATSAYDLSVEAGVLTSSQAGGSAY
jgi:cyanophycinase